MWLSIAIAAGGALCLVSLVRWRFPNADLRGIHGLFFAVAAGLFWGVLALALHLFYWDSYYRYFAPTYVNWLTPLAALFYALVGWGMDRLACRLPGNFAINFGLLGALESIPEHLLAIYRFKILEIPMFRGIDPASIFLFAFFEYAIYWSLVLLLAVILDRLWRRKIINRATG